LAAAATGTSTVLVRMRNDNPSQAQSACKSLTTFRHLDELVGGEYGSARTGYIRTEVAGIMRLRPSRFDEARPHRVAQPYS